MDNAGESWSLPGLIGVVTCDGTGEVESFTGEEAEMFGAVVPYFNQIATLVGETFGLDEFEQGMLIGKNVTCVTIAGSEESRGFIFEAKAKINQILPKLL